VDKLVRERRVSVAQAARDLDVHENVLRKWVKEFGSDAAQAFPGHGQMKPEQLEIERLRREVNKLKAERDILFSACTLGLWAFAAGLVIGTFLFS
jgi:transposase